MPDAPPKATPPLASRPGVLRQATVVMSGSLFAQALGLLVAPLLARLYAPEAYGTFGVFLALTAVLVPISTWTLESAIALPKSTVRGAHVLLAALAAIAATSAAIGAVLVVGGAGLAAALRLDVLGPYLPLLPVYVAFGGANLALGFWLVRTERFGRLTSSKIAQSVGTAATQLGVGLASAVPGGLILGSLAGQVAAVVVAAIAVPPRDRRAAGRLARRGTWRWAYRAYGDFPRLKVPQRVLAASSDAALVVGLSVAFSPAAAGYYALMRRVLALPVELVGESVRKALVPRIAETTRSSPAALARLLARSSTALLLLALLPAAALVVAGPWLFGLVFGATWETAGAYARVIGVMVAIRFAAVPYLTAIPMLRLNRLHLVADALRFALTIAAFAAAASRGDVTLALIGFAVAGVTSDGIVVLAVRTRLAAARRERAPG